MDYYIIAGEASGDLHASGLMRELRLRDPAARFRCWGGDLMQQAGGVIVTHYRDMAYMGFVEVLRHLPAIWGNIRKCKRDLFRHRPTVLILVDFPGFNLRIAEYAQKQGIPVFYYISPKIWAWNQRRALKIKRVVDRMFCILPFEVAFYRRWGMDVDYVGNPLVDAIAAWKSARADAAGELAAKASSDKPVNGSSDVPVNGSSDKPVNGSSDVPGEALANEPIIALLPGSRKQEITRILPEMLRATDHFKQARIVVAGAPSFTADFYKPIIGNRQVNLVFERTYDLLHSARAALVASGTATLEAALLNVPQVVLYKANALSVAIARRVIKVKYISLVNLIADKAIVKELIQDDCNEEQITAELRKLMLAGENRRRLLADYESLREEVGAPGASARAAEKMLRYLSE